LDHVKRLYEDRSDIASVSVQPTVKQEGPFAALDNTYIFKQALVILAGFALLAAALAVAGWNEFRQTDHLRRINAAADSFVNVTCPVSDYIIVNDATDGTNDPAKVYTKCCLNPSNEGDLVHLVCPLTGLEKLGVWLAGLEFAKENQLRGLRLESDIEVYEWVEVVKNISSTKICDTLGANDQTSALSCEGLGQEIDYQKTWTRTHRGTEGFQDPDKCRRLNLPNQTQCFNTNPNSQFWWTDDMSVVRYIYIYLYIHTYIYIYII